MGAKDFAFLSVRQQRTEGIAFAAYGYQRLLECTASVSNAVRGVTVCDLLQRLLVRVLSRLKFPVPSKEGEGGSHHVDVHFARLERNHYPVDQLAGNAFKGQYLVDVGKEVIRPTCRRGAHRQNNLEAKP